MTKTRVDTAAVSTTKATFIFGGASSWKDFEYLEADASEWISNEIINCVGCTSGHQKGCAVTIPEDDEILLIGGYGSGTEKRILSFNVTNHTFKTLTMELQQGRQDHRCSIIPGTRNIIVTGGKQAKEYTALNSTEIINVDAKEVITSTDMDMIEARAEHGIAIVNIDNQDRIVVFGGWVGDQKAINNTEMYNAQTKKWESISKRIKLSEAKWGFGYMTIKSQA